MTLTEGEFDLTFKSFTASWTTPGTLGAIDRAYTDASVDMVLAVGFLANQLAVTRKTFEKPTFAAGDQCRADGRTGVR